MASISREGVPTVQPRQQVSDNSFSIKNILNLPEEPGEDECARVLNREENCPVFGFPIVPQAIRPVAFNMDESLSPMYSTAQWLSAARHFPPWLLGTRFMRFLPGE